MAKYNVHAGHCPQGKGAYGATGLLNESVEDRIVKNEVIRLLKAAGHTVYDCTCDSNTTQNGCLNAIVKKCNAHTVALDVSIHLNSGRKDKKGDGKTGGVEVLIYSNGSSSKDEAKRICEAISKELDITNRGVKVNSGLYVLNSTKAPALLIECCFVDDKDDYEKWDAKKCAKAIVKGILNKDVQISSGLTGTGTSKPAAKKPSNSSSYYKKVSGKYVSISDALRSTGANGSYANRKKIAKKNGIAGYKGTPAQNKKMLSLLKKGKLKKA